MSEEEALVGSEDPSLTVAGSVPTASAGSLLREARIAAGVHIESIAFSLKVPVGKIDALERDDASAFSDATFMRALASSVCRGLRIDAAPILALMPRGPKHRLAEQSERPRATFRDPSSNSNTPAWAGRSSRWLAASVFLLLMGAAAVALIPQDWELPRILGVTSTPAPLGAAPVVPAVSASNANPRVTSNVGSSLQPSPPSMAAPAAPSFVEREPVQELPESSLVSLGSPVLPQPIAEQAASGAAIDGGQNQLTVPRLALIARGETWVQVTDETRKVVLERILKAGDSVSVNQPGRLSVVIGRADVTDVRVQGETRDVTKNARDNVARFEVAK